MSFCQYVPTCFAEYITKNDKNMVSLRWRHNGRDSVSNHQPHDCLLKRIFRRRSKKTSKLRVTGLCAGNSPGTGEFPAQRASNAENVSIWWSHHGIGGIKGLHLNDHSLQLTSRHKYARQCLSPYVLGINATLAPSICSHKTRDQRLSQWEKTLHARMGRCLALPKDLSGNTSGADIACIIKSTGYLNPYVAYQWVYHWNQPTGPWYQKTVYDYTQAVVIFINSILLWLFCHFRVEYNWYHFINGCTNSNRTYIKTREIIMSPTAVKALVLITNNNLSCGVLMFSLTVVHVIKHIIGVIS